MQIEKNSFGLFYTQLTFLSISITFVHNLKWNRQETERTDLITNLRKYICSFEFSQLSDAEVIMRRHQPLSVQVVWTGIFSSISLTIMQSLTFVAFVKTAMGPFSCLAMPNSQPNTDHITQTHNFSSGQKKNKGYGYTSKVQRRRDILTKLSNHDISF